MDTLDLLCSCSIIESETKAHFFLRCHFYKAILVNYLENIDQYWKWTALMKLPPLVYALLPPSLLPLS